MSIFLNTAKMTYWIQRLIREAEKEVVLIVPYIRTSKELYDSLLEADKKGIEVTLVYRENKLSNEEKRKVLGIEHLNLLHHPNVHCKCYFNGNMLIIGSMNLYEYSEKNNREMGILFNWETITDEEGNEHERVWKNRHVFTSSIAEIREILNGATLEKYSPLQKNGFEIDIVKTREEREQEECETLNKYFLNKKFKPYKDEHDNWSSVCRNYFDKIDVFMETKRVAITFNLSEGEIATLKEKWNAVYEEFEFRGFKYYTNFYCNTVHLYLNWDFEWDKLTDKQVHLKLKQGIDAVIGKYRELMGR